MSELNAGDVVDIHISAARVHNIPSDESQFYAFQIGGDNDRPRYLQIHEGMITAPNLRIDVIHSMPAEYPPVAGDVWQIVDDETSTYWAAADVDEHAAGIGVRLVCLSYHEHGSTLTTPEELLDHGRPSLVFPSPLRASRQAHGDHSVTVDYIQRGNSAPGAVTS